MRFPAAPYAHRRYFLGGSILIWSGLVAFFFFWVRRSFSLTTYIGWLAWGAAVIGAVVYTYRVWALERLMYLVDRDGVYVRWGAGTFVLPMGKIQQAVRGAEMSALPRPSRWMWPARYVWFGEFEGRKWFVFASAPWEQGLFLCGEDVCVGVTPKDSALLVRAVNERRALGPNRFLALAWRWPRWTRWSFWQDSIALTGVIAGIVFLILLWGEAAIRLDLPRILAMARLGSYLLLVDWLLGWLLYRRERLAGVILWWGGSAILAILLIGLWVMRI